MDPLLLVGLNHRAASIEVREKLAFHPERLCASLKRLQEACPQGTELCLLSTCNRSEVVAFSGDPEKARAAIYALLAEHARLATEELAGVCYEYRGRQAAHHLLRVAGGLDSIIIGESEILGQVRGAFEAAQQARTAGAALSALLRAALRVGKRVHSETEIGRSSLSIATIVVELAQEALGKLNDRTALLVGAGKISSMTARALSEAGLHCILVANRTFERAEKLAASLNGQAVHFNEMPGRLLEADIVICSTGAPHTVLHTETVLGAMGKRGGAPLLIADLAVPRDADPQIAGIPGVKLVDIDELDDLVQARHPLAAATRQRAEEIVCEELECLQAWLEGRQNAALICELQERVNAIVSDQVEITARKLGGLTAEERQALETMGKAIASRILHEPIHRLKQGLGEPQAEDLEALVIRLFGLN